jgi:hypothetical protein
LLYAWTSGTAFHRSGGSPGEPSNRKKVGTPPVASPSKSRLTVFGAAPATPAASVAAARTVPIRPMDFLFIFGCPPQNDRIE